MRIVRSGASRTRCQQWGQVADVEVFSGATSAIPDGNLPSLSVVIPAFNAAATLPGTVGALLDDADAAGWHDLEVVLVDDGSDDGTAASLDGLAHRCRLVVIRQENAGRFRARHVGLTHAKGDLALLLDSRITIASGSMRFLASEVAAGRNVWNAHVVTAPSPSLPAHFWDGITAVAWRRYYRDPRHVELTPDNFDYYPKGTTMFVAPRQLLLEACVKFDTGVDDLRMANDDTLMLQPLLDHGPIHLAPEFGCTYHSRTSLGSFVRHSYHRGTVLIDGHDRPGSRFRTPIRVVLVAVPLLTLMSLIRPLVAVRLAFIASFAAGVAVRAVGGERRAAVSLGVLSPLFGVSYYAGMVRGEVARLASRRRLRVQTGADS